jgi:hypothetical protein
MMMENDLLFKFCYGRLTIRSGMIAERQEDLGPTRYSPRLGGKDISIGGKSIFDSRADALAAGRAFRIQCLRELAQRVAA